MPVYVEILGVEPEDLKQDQRTGENCHDDVALANLVYGALKNTDLDGNTYYDVEELSEELSYFTEEVTGVTTVVNEDMHEKITGRRPEYDD